MQERHEVQRETLRRGVACDHRFEGVTDLGDVHANDHLEGAALTDDAHRSRTRESKSGPIWLSSEHDLVIR